MSTIQKTPTSFPSYFTTFPSTNYKMMSSNNIVVGSSCGVVGGSRCVSSQAANTKENNQIIAFHSSAQWKAYFEASKQYNKLVVIYFTATWCGPCQSMDPTIKELACNNTGIDLVKIDVDELFNVSCEFGIQTMPTFVFMKNGKEIDRVLGARKDDLQRKVQKHTT